MHKDFFFRLLIRLNIHHNLYIARASNFKQHTTEVMAESQQRRSPWKNTRRRIGGGGGSSIAWNNGTGKGLLIAFIILNGLGLSSIYFSSHFYDTIGQVKDRTHISHDPPKLSWQYKRQFFRHNKTKFLVTGPIKIVLSKKRDVIKMTRNTTVTISDNSSTMANSSSFGNDGSNDTLSASLSLYNHTDVHTPSIAFVATTILEKVRGPSKTLASDHNLEKNETRHETAHITNGTTANVALSLPSTRTFDVSPERKGSIVNANTKTTRSREISKVNDEEEEQRRFRREQSTTLKQLLQLGFKFTDIFDFLGLNPLPPWSSIVKLYGDQPKVVGLEMCQAYRNAVPLDQRLMGLSGLFHTGTNLITELLTESCSLPRKGDSALWSVPWGKHNPIEAYHDNYVIEKPVYQQIHKANVLPIVLVRNPVDWMTSMCRQPYSAKWHHNRTHCPNLQEPVQLNLYRPFKYPNLVQAWLKWNGGWYGKEDISPDTVPPRLMVRWEDLVYHPQSTLSQICNCIGGEFRWNVSAATKIWSQPQGGVVAPSKKSDFAMITAWQRHASVKVSNFLQLDDQVKTMQQLKNQSLIEIFGYNIF